MKYMSDICLQDWIWFRKPSEKLMSLRVHKTGGLWDRQPYRLTSFLADFCEDLRDIIGLLGSPSARMSHPFPYSLYIDWQMTTVTSWILFLNRTKSTLQGVESHIPFYKTHPAFYHTCGPSSSYEWVHYTEMLWIAQYWTFYIYHLFDTQNKGFT